MKQEEKNNPLRKLRIAKKLTQKEMGKKLNLERTTYNKWENNNSKISLEGLKKIIKVLEPSQEDLMNILEYEGTSQKEKDVIDAYRKTISYFKGALINTFDFFLYNHGSGIAEIHYTPFEELTEERKGEIAEECNQVLTKEVYTEYCEKDRRLFFEEDYYDTFCWALQDNPFAVVLLHFGVFGDRYEDVFERWCKDTNKYKDSISDKLIGMSVRLDREYYSTISLNLTGELQEEKKNFTQIINSEKMIYKEEAFNYSITY